jgi:hypothetical protein
VALLNDPVLTDLFAGIPVVADTAAWDAGHFSPLSAVPLFADFDCLDAVELRRTGLVR